MKFLLASISSLLLCMGVAQAQTSPENITDTTIYEVAERLPFPLFKGCMANGRAAWNADSTRKCSEIQLLNLFSSNIIYPQEAREKNIQGTVVLSFVVEPSNGRISYPKILKDIGGGCGEEALRVLKALDEAGMRWASATIGEQQVRIRHSLPLRFRLQEALPYFISENGDTIYQSYDVGPQFKTGVDSLFQFVINRLDYPEKYLDSCKTGVVEMALLVKSNGTTQVENVVDFNNLGLDFQWEAMRLANKTAGMWIPATFENKPVGTMMPLRVVFKSDAKGCGTANDRFDQAMILADQAAELLNQDKGAEAIQKYSEALKLHPDNCELLYYRGTALLNANKKEDACADFNRVKTLLGITWFEDIRRLVCGW